VDVFWEIGEKSLAVSEVIAQKRVTPIFQLLISSEDSEHAAFEMPVRIELPEGRIMGPMSASKLPIALALA